MLFTPLITDYIYHVIYYNHSILCMYYLLLQLVGASISYLPVIIVLMISFICMFKYLPGNVDESVSFTKKINFCYNVDFIETSNRPVEEVMHEIIGDEQEQEQLLLESPSSQLQHKEHYGTDNSLLGDFF